MKTKRRRLLPVALALFLLLQLLPLNWAFASGDDLTSLDQLVIHGTEYTDGMPSSLTITGPDDVEIEPDDEGNYINIPAGAKIDMTFAFHLKDGNDDETIPYEYDGSEFFTAVLPAGVSFNPAGGDIIATHTPEDGDPYNYVLATWTISGNILRVELTTAAEDTLAGKGASDPDHLEKEGYLSIKGTFLPLEAGGDEDTSMTFGATETIVIKRQPLPKESTLTKSGAYDAATNTITWTVTVTPPVAEPGLSFEGYTLIDVFSAGQTYVAESFTHGDPVADSALDLTGLASAQTIKYTFPGETSGVQTITYQTRPDNFVKKEGSVEKPVTDSFTNTASLMRGEDEAAEPKTAQVPLTWLGKSGAAARTTAEPTRAKWTVTVNVPGKAGSAISAAKIVDTLPAHLEVIRDDSTNSPVEIKFGSAAAVKLAGSDYTYAANDTTGDTLTYTFGDGKPAAGEKVTLTFYTKVKTDFLNGTLDDNDAIPFSNDASLEWIASGTPLKAIASGRIGTGIGSGGLISKGAGSTLDYDDTSTVAGKGRVIKWTVTVNNNKIDMAGASISDTMTAGQELLIDDAGHPFTVTKKGSLDTQIAQFTSYPAVGSFIATTGGFTYTFPDEAGGSGEVNTIKSTYTVTFYSKIVDTSSLYSNGNPNGHVGFTNSVTLNRTGKDGVTTSGTQTYNSQMIKKSVATDYNYNYNTRTVQWQLVINRNRLDLTNAVVADTLPEGMSLRIDTDHPFTVTNDTPGEDGTQIEQLTDPEATSDNFTATTVGFTYDLPATKNNNQYTVTFWTLMDEETLTEQWPGTRDFKNTGTLTATEIKTPISSSATEKITNPVLGKTYSYEPDSDHIDWSIVINPGKVLMTGGFVEDQLSTGLQLDLDTLKLSTITVKDGDGTMASVIDDLTRPGDY